MKYAVYLALISTASASSSAATNLNRADRVARRQARRDARNTVDEAEAEAEETVEEAHHEVTTQVMGDIERMQSDYNTMQDDAQDEMTEYEQDVADWYANMPQPPSTQEVESGEEIVAGWVERGSSIMEDAQPAIDARNQRIMEAAEEHKTNENRISERLVEDVEDAQQDWERDTQRAHERLEADLEADGVPEAWEALGDQIEADMEWMETNMRRVRRSTQALKARAARTQSLQASGEWPEDAPTPGEWPEGAPTPGEWPGQSLATTAAEAQAEMPTAEEIDAAKATLADWMNRADHIVQRATPAHDVRDQKIAEAWETRERRNQRSFNRGVEDIIDAQQDFEEEVMEAQAEMEETLTNNGAIADWEALQDQVEADMNTMQNMIKRVRLMQRRNDLHRRASAKLATNLGALSDEMRANATTAEQEDACRTMVISWVQQYEAIMETAQPAIDRRDSEVMEAAEDREEEMMDAAETMFDDWEHNDDVFEDKVMRAQQEMLDSFEEDGITADAEALGEEIDATLHQMEQNMFRLRQHSRAIRTTQLTGTHEGSEWLEDNWPSGEYIVRRNEMETQWVEEAERILDVMEPTVKRHARDMRDADEDRMEENQHTLEGAWNDYEENDTEFWENVVDAQDDMMQSLEDDGIVARDEALKDDIEAQFEEWGSMRRVAPVQSLSTRDRRSVQTMLRKLERQIDGVLTNM